jgi:pyruvate formate lyase activating enzyme
VFLKGCPLRCWWCHNPESQGREPFVHYQADRCLGCGSCVEACARDALALTPEGIARDPVRCTGGATCAEACPAEARRLIGRRMGVDALLDEVERDRLYYETSGGGVTFSGGEPLHQWRFLLAALERCGRRDLHRVVDTTGFASQEVLMRAAAETDLFLYDLKVMDPAVHRRVTGVPLAPIVENLERLLRAGARVRVRIPLVPGITTDASIEATAAFLAGVPAVEGVDLLPFHRSAEDKHRKFGVPWQLEAAAIPEDRVAGWRERLAEHGLNAKVGG